MELESKGSNLDDYEVIHRSESTPKNKNLIRDNFTQESPAHSLTVNVIKTTVTVQEDGTRIEGGYHQTYVETGVSNSFEFEDRGHGQTGSRLQVREEDYQSRYENRNQGDYRDSGYMGQGYEERHQEEPGYQHETAMDYTSHENEESYNREYRQDTRPIKPLGVSYDSINDPMATDSGKRDNRGNKFSDDRPISGKGAYDVGNKDAMEIVDESSRLRGNSGSGEKKAASPSRRPRMTLEQMIAQRAEARKVIDEERTVKEEYHTEDVPIKNSSEERPIKVQRVNNFEDEKPIGGGGKSFNPDGERPLGGGTRKFQAEDERPIGGGGNSFNPDDERPIGGGNKKFQAEDERPIGGGARGFSHDDERPIGGGRSFNPDDERPLKASQNNMFLENEGMEGGDDQGGPMVQETGPLSSRVNSKVWKVRQMAFEELTSILTAAPPNDPVFQEYAGDLLKFVGDANPGAQEKAIEAFKVYLQKQGSSGIDEKNAIKTLVDKAISPGKPNIKKAALEVLCLLFEKGNSGSIFEGINDCIKHKNQKTACAGVQTLVELMVNYGPKKLDFLKPFFPNVEKLASSTTSALRTEAMSFYKEAYKYMGDALKPFITKLKKAQLDELEKYFAEAPQQLSKPLKSNEERGVANIPGLGKAKGGAVEDSNGAGEPEFDAYDIVDPVDIFKKFNEAWSEKVLEQSKWSDKKAMLDELLKEASLTPKIANMPYQHITAMLKRLLNDNNINVMITAIKIYGALAKGLRKNFNVTCKIAVPFLIAKLKDKRAQTIEETRKSLDNFFYCITLDEIIEDVKEALNDKTLEIKVQTLSWIDRYCDRTQKTPEKLTNLFKNLSPIVKKLLDDSSGDVRESSMKVLGKWKALLGDSVVAGSYGDINPQKLARINEIVENAASNTGPGAARLVGTPIANKSKAVKLNESMEEEKLNRPATRGGEVTKSDNKTGANRPNTAMSKQASTKKIGASTKSTLPVQNLAAKLEDEAGSNLTAEDAEAKMAELGLPGSISSVMNSDSWKEKQRGLAELNHWLNENIPQVAQYLEHVFRYLKAKLKDWKESNLNILKETFSIITSLVTNKEVALNKKAFSVVVSFITANIQDSKYAESSQTIVYTFIEATNPKSIVGFLINSIQDPKTSKPNPKALVEMCKLLSKLVDDVTVKFLPLKEVIDFGKTVISNQNPAARTAATSLLKSIYQQIGSQLTDLINDINPQTFKSLQAEFDKIVPAREVQCKIQFREGADAELKEMANSNPLDSLPRTDISKEAEKLFKKLTDNDWKVRKEGLDALENLVTASGNRILPNGLYDLVAILKTRLSDNNKSQAKNFIVFVGRFATALGPGAKVHAKVLVTELVRNLSDKQATIRQESLNALQKFTAEVGSTMVINSMLPLLVQENPEMRTEVINWILTNSDSLAKAEIRQNISPVLSVLNDKTKEIRILAEKLLEKCIAIIGSSPYVSALKDLKPAIQQALRPIVEKYKSENEMETEGGEPNMEQTQTQTQTQTQKNAKKNVSEVTILKGKTQSQKPTPTPNINLSAIANNSEQKVNKPSSPKKGAVTHTAAGSSYSPDFRSLNNSALSAMPSGNIINILGQKGRRQEEEKKHPWSTEELQDESVERLRNYLKMSVAPELFLKMFSVDHKKHLDAINILKKALVQEFQGTIDILDLIVKWFFMRLWDNANLQIIKESVDYFVLLVTSLESAQYGLLDFEADILLPCIISKLGMSAHNFQPSLYKLIQKLGAVCSPAKVAVSLLHGMNSSNMKTRIESMDVLAKLVGTYGSNILTQKDIKVFGKLLNHKDDTIKTKSFNILCQVGKMMGESLFAIIEKEAPPKAVEDIREKIKEYINNPDTSKNVDIDMNQMQEEEEFENQPLYDPSSPNRNEMRIEAQDKQTGGNNEEFLLGKARSPKEESKDSVLSKKIDVEHFERSVNLLVNGSVSNKLDALLFIYDIATSESEESKVFLKDKANMLAQALQAVLGEVFEKPRKEIPAKFLVYFLNMVHKLCSSRIFLKVINVTQDNLRAFSEEVLNRLLSEDEEKTEDHNESIQLDKTESESIVKTLNSTMLRILENSDPNDMFDVLFDLLIKNRRRLNNYTKILGLTIKCLLKLTKALEQLLDVIHPEKILLKCHVYLLEFGTDPTKLGEDIGVKTIKTVLNELVKLYHEKIWEFYAQSVQIHPRQDNYLHRWITVLLRPFVGAPLVSPRYPNQNSPRSRTLSEEKMIKQPALSNKDQGGNVKQEEIPAIRALIESLKRSDNFEEGIKHLSEVLTNYPGHNIAPYFVGCTKTFTDYVTLALERVKSQRNNFCKEDSMILCKPMIDGNQQGQNENEVRAQLRAFGMSNRANLQGDRSREYSPGGLNLDDLHSKVNSLKAKYGLAANLSNFVNQNMSMDSYGEKPALGRNPTPGRTHMGLTSENEMAYAAQGGQVSASANTSQESLLQKFSEMKMRLKTDNFAKSINPPS